LMHVRAGSGKPDTECNVSDTTEAAPPWWLHGHPVAWSWCGTRVETTERKQHPTIGCRYRLPRPRGARRIVAQATWIPHTTSCRRAAPSC